VTSVAHIIRRRRSKRARKRITQDRNHLWGGLIAIVLGVSIILPVSIVIGVTGFLYAQAASVLPSPASTIYLDPIVGSTELYDRDVQELLFSVQDPLGDNRIWLEVSDLPSYVIDATLLMEDRDFLQATQFNAADTLNNLWWYVIGTPVANDVSITGRLVRNAIIPSVRDRNLDESLLQIVLTAEITRQYTPEVVLEWHLNTNYYGNDAYGIEAAAQVYLGKSAAELTLDEATLLAAIPPAPQFNPFDNELAARGRQADLLQLLLDSGRITRLDYDAVALRQTPLRTDLVQVPRIAPEFSVFARQQAEDILDSVGLDGARMVARDGLRIVTTLDLDLFYQSDCVLKSHLATWNAQLDDGLTLIGDPCISRDFLETPLNLDLTAPPAEGAIVILDVRTGELRSIVGTVNRPIYQPGPTIHPFVYFEGFRSAEFTPASMVMDIPQAFPGPADGLIYTPTNIDGQFRGPINVRDAMVASLLPPAVHVANSRGLSRVWATAHRIGLNTLDEAEDDLALLEQGGNVSVLDIAYTYSVFASMGTMRGVDVEPIARGFRSRDPVAVLRIEDADGNILWEYPAESPEQIETNIFASSLGFLVNSILSDSTTRNAVLDITDTALSIGRPVAVVHGNTRDLQDNWTVGYTPQYVTAVHLGRNDDVSMTIDNYGLQGATPIWQALMRYVHQRENLPPEDWQRPADIAEFVVCDKSGLLPGNDAVCPTRNEIFIANIPPLQSDSYWQQYELNSQTRQLATANTPSNLRTEFVFFVPPQSAMEWWQSNGLPLPPH
jgi:membrane carboxypeptidase/penicillin-binding protein